ncbi:hypothetical protein KR018_001488, partial [Drosophila ironensis]
WPRIRIMSQDRRYILPLLLLLSPFVAAEAPTYHNGNMNADDALVDTTGPLDPGQPKQLSIQSKPSAGYMEYDSYLGPRRIGDSYGPKNDVAPKIHGELNLASLNQPVYKSLPWYGEYAGNPSTNVPLYRSRSYDPYIRRYDRFDEQYHRTSPQYLEDMYVYRQRYDPYDSYSPRVPQYPEPYVMYPNRYLDTPTPREAVKPGHGYSEDNMSLLDYNYNGRSKYGANKIPDTALLTRNERIVYYAHLPEIVRTPYEDTRTEDKSSAPLTMPPSPYKLNKKKV